MRFAASAVLGVALVLFGLSLSHLASGVAIVTGAGYSDGWAMAIGIDLGFIALELATLVAPADKRDVVTRYAAPAIVGTLAISAAMNAFAFAAHADGLMISCRRTRARNSCADLCPGKGCCGALD